MSSLDQAFIRAYAKDRADQQSAPPLPDRPEAGAETSPLLQPHTIVVVPPIGQSPSIDPTRLTATPLGQPPLLAMPSLSDTIQSHMAAGPVGASPTHGASSALAIPATVADPSSAGAPSIDTDNQPNSSGPTSSDCPIRSTADESHAAEISALTAGDAPQSPGAPSTTTDHGTITPDDPPPSAAAHRADPPQAAEPILLIDGPAARRVPRPHRRGFGSSPPHPSIPPDHPTSPPPADEHLVPPVASTASHGAATIHRIDPAASTTSATATAPHSPSWSPHAPATSPQPHASSQAFRSAAPASPTHAADPIGYRVQQFVFPRLCRRLLRAATPMFDRLANDMIAGMRRGRRVCLISSHRRSEGRTTLTLCLASLLSRHALRLLLVDGDFDNPRLATCLGIEPEIGWESAASVDVEPPEILIHPIAQPGLALLPRCEPQPHALDAAETPTAPDWKSDLLALRRAFDLILIDGPPLSALSLSHCPSGQLAGCIDTALLVRSVRQTTADELLMAQRGLERLGVNHGGVVENFVSTN